MTIETVFYTQIGSVLAFIVAIFVLYRAHLWGQVLFFAHLWGQVLFFATI